MILKKHYSFKRVRKWNLYRYFSQSSGLKEVVREAKASREKVVTHCWAVGSYGHFVYIPAGKNIDMDKLEFALFQGTYYYNHN